jgi:hypothetical protein
MLKFLHKLPTSISILSLSTFLSINAYAQLGHGLQAGLTFSSFSNDTLKSTGGMGYDFQYFVFAKYSSKLEWTSGFGVTTAKREEIPTINYDPFAPSGFPEYTLSTTTKNAFLLNYRYALTYYIIPDVLGITGGIELGTGVISNFGTSWDGGKYLLQSVDTNLISGTNLSSSAYSVSRMEINSFFWAPTFGISYTYDMRYTIAARYHLYGNTYFSSEDSNLPDASRLNLFLITASYKFLPSPKKSRF